MRTNLDLNLVFLDFADEYEHQPRQAVHALQALLLDEDVCRARIAFLKRLATTKPQDRPSRGVHIQAFIMASDHDEGRDRKVSDFSAELRAILELGTFRLEQGRLSVDRLDALTRDPDALWQAHRELMADLVEEPANSDPDLEPQTPMVPGPGRLPEPDPRFRHIDRVGSGGMGEIWMAESSEDSGIPRAIQGYAEGELARSGEPTGFTTLVGRQDWSELAGRLRPYLPEVLRTVGLDEALRDPLLEIILKRARTLDSRERRFRELLPGWLEEFAVQAGIGPLPHPLRQEDWEAIIDRAVLRIVLDQEREGEPEWVRQFRRTARLSRAASWQGCSSSRCPRPSR